MLRLPSWSITLIDETGNSALMRGTLAADTSADTALAYVTALASAVSPISGCVPVRVSVSYRVAITPLFAPVNGFNALDVAAITFYTSEDNQFVVMGVPGISRSLLRADGCFAGVELEGEDLSAFIGAVSGGIWTDPFGNDIGEHISSFLRRAV